MYITHGYCTRWYTVCSGVRSDFNSFAREAEDKCVIGMGTGHFYVQSAIKIIASHCVYYVLNYVLVCVCVCGDVSVSTREPRCSRMKNISANFYSKTRPRHYIIYHCHTLYINVCMYVCKSILFSLQLDSSVVVVASVKHIL